MRFIAILRTTRPLERPVQTFHPSREDAGAWAQAILATVPQDSEDTVEIFELVKRKIATIKRPRPNKAPK